MDLIFPKKRHTKIIISVLAIILLVFGALFIYCPPPGDIPVLMYHFVGDKKLAAERKNFVSREGFAWQMAFLKFFKYRVISMDEFYDIKTGRRKPLGREIMITFDDANYTFETGALPILEEYQFPVTIFAVSESAKRGVQGSMTGEALRRLKETGWITIGSHSKTHPLLSRMNTDEIRHEVADSKKDLETMVGGPIHYFAYPSSDIDAEVVKLVRDAGYRLAFATSIKKIRGLGEGLYTITRVKITRSSDIPIVFWAKISGLYSFFKRQRELLKGFFSPSQA